MQVILAGFTIIFPSRTAKNRKTIIWSGSTVLNVLGIYRSGQDYKNFNKKDRLRAAKILKELWIEGCLVRKLLPSTKTFTWKEHAHVRPEDAPSKYAIACLLCHSEVIVQRSGLPQKDICEKCDKR